MASTFRLSQRMFSKAFWDSVLSRTEEWRNQQIDLANALAKLEKLRDGGDYNTGSISFAAAWSLYCLIRYFRPVRIAEVGTFIGKSTVSMASACDAERLSAQVASCDHSNNIHVPWSGKTKIRQFPKCGSTDMLRQLEPSIDFLFLDGRVGSDDVAILENLMSPQMIVGLDDFEGIEKGVANAEFLRKSEKFRSHFLVHPASEEQLHRIGLTGHSLIAILLPVSLIELTPQG